MACAQLVIVDVAIDGTVMLDMMIVMYVRGDGVLTRTVAALTRRSSI